MEREREREERREKREREKQNREKINKRIKIVVNCVNFFKDLFITYQHTLSLLYFVFGKL